MNQPRRARAYYDSARILLEAKVQEQPEESRYHSTLGFAYAGLGRKTEATQAAKYAVELLPVSKNVLSGPYRLASLARIYVMVGEHDAALELLDHLLSIPMVQFYPLLEFAPVWAPLRDHPRFQKLLERRI